MILLELRGWVVEHRRRRHVDHVVVGESLRLHAEIWRHLLCWLGGIRRQRVVKLIWLGGKGVVKLFRIWRQGVAKLFWVGRLRVVRHVGGWWFLDGRGIRVERLGDHLA